MSRAYRPTVSVVIPCYNQGHFLAEAIDSVLGQTYPHVEAIVVDDGSTDETAAVASRYGDRIRYFYKRNAGLSAARNSGILAGRGDFLLFLDADDYLKSDSLAWHMEAACAAPSGSVFYGGCQFVDQRREVRTCAQKASLPGDAFHSLLVGNPFPCHALTIRREALANTGLFDVRLRACEDWDLWLRLAAAGCEFVEAPGAICVYRRYPSSMSHNPERMWLCRREVLRKSKVYHGSCVKCETAIALGLRQFRQQYCERFVRGLYDEKARAGIGASLAMIARAVLRDPDLGIGVVREWAKCRRGERSQGTVGAAAKRWPQSCESQE